MKNNHNILIASEINNICNYINEKLKLTKNYDKLL